MILVSQFEFLGEGTGVEVGHMFQYKIWKLSLDMKLVVSLVLILTLSILLQLYSSLFIRQVGRVMTQKEVVDSLILSNGNTTVAYAELDSLSNDFFSYLNATIILNICTIGYLIHDFQGIIYLHLRGIHINTYNWLLILNVISTLIFIIWMIIYYGDYAAGLGGIRSEERASVIIQRMIDDNKWNYKVSTAIPVSIQFARLVYALQVNRTFGPMVKILMTMMMNLALFLVLFTVIFFIFVGAGQILFSELADFSNLENTMKTLFSSSVGEFSYNTYDSLQEIDPKVGYVYITVFMIIISVMLLNFLIAILSTTYSNLNMVKNGLYMRKVIQYRQRYNYDRYYSSIVYAPPPLNLISMFFLPFLALRKSKYNEMLLI